MPQLVLLVPESLLTPGWRACRISGGVEPDFLQACEQKVVAQSHVNNLPIIPDVELARLATRMQEASVSCVCWSSPRNGSFVQKKGIISETAGVP